MSKYPLVRKDYIIKRNRNAFCSKCGKMLLQDEYHYNAHAWSKCLVTYEKHNPVKEGECYAYSFDIQDGILIFRGHSLVLKNRRGFKDKFVGSEWKEIFRAEFFHHSKKIKESGAFTVDAWFKKLIDINKITCLNADDPKKIIHDFFPSVVDIYSYGMFLDIYRQKGYPYSPICIEDVKRIAEPEWPPADYKIPEWSGEGFVVTSLHDMKDQMIIRADFFDRDEYDTKHFNKQTFFISNNFIYSTTTDNYKILSRIPCYDVVSDEKYIFEKFSMRYPSLMLDAYMDGGGRNPMHIIVSANYNKCIELLGKAGLSVICDNFYLIQDILNVHANNLQDMFNLPLKVIKSLNSSGGIEFLLWANKDFADILSSTYRHQPAIFDCVLNRPTLGFMALAHKDENIMRVFRKKKDFLRAFRYIQDLSSGPNSGLWLNTMWLAPQYYVDYINMCVQLGRFPDGKFPQYLSDAHNLASRIVHENSDKILKKQFKEAVTREEYASLASDYNIDDTEDSSDNDTDKYVIRVPQSPKDLQDESDALHHCVKSYVKRVAEKNTCILFLRKKEDPDTPYATIEVKDGNLIQLKTKLNKEAPEEVKDYVRRWAESKAIRIVSLW